MLTTCVMSSECPKWIRFGPSIILTMHALVNLILEIIENRLKNEAINAFEILLRLSEGVRSDVN